MCTRTCFGIYAHRLGCYLRTYAPLRSLRNPRNVANSYNFAGNFHHITFFCVIFEPPGSHHLPPPRFRKDFLASPRAQARTRRGRGTSKESRKACSYGWWSMAGAQIYTGYLRTGTHTQLLGFEHAFSTHEYASDVTVYGFSLFHRRAIHHISLHVLEYFLEKIRETKLNTDILYKSQYWNLHHFSLLNCFPWFFPENLKIQKYASKSERFWSSEKSVIFHAYSGIAGFLWEKYQNPNHNHDEEAKK